ncbi:PSD1 and planctomycete cytochrome C domain-containing protein [Rhodopirellula sp.]|nr:PSD1 and planctomycete cytochrome C domain-containing protein [Rhodopirellula sp.]
MQYAQNKTISPRWIRCCSIFFVMGVTQISWGSDFSREIRPLLARHCFKCHGPDDEARQADLRLDIESAAKKDLGGYAAVVSGDLAGSELMGRVDTDDPDVRMPPPESGRKLTENEIAILGKWIESGGNYQKHWALVPPVQTRVPRVSNARWCLNPIDHFILNRLEDAELRPAGEAGREHLIRRLSLDLIGTTPLPDEVDRFLADQNPGAYVRLVDRLLASPGYAERFARPWLDLARYSDTNGYEKDRNRTIWPYRDWVISAVGADMPFDQFSIEQLAGDMLPQATNQQRIATGFHRNTMLNEEGGIDPMEYRYHAIVDRVATTGTVWMGLTTGCAQCHTHKYDPITHSEYFGLFALLNNADEPDVVVSDSQRDLLVAGIQRRITDAETQLIKSWLPSFQQFQKYKNGREDSAATTRKADWKFKSQVALVFYEWVESLATLSREWRLLKPVSMKSSKPLLEVLPDFSIRARGDVTKREVYLLKYLLPDGEEPFTALRLDVLPDISLPAGGPGLAFYEGRRGDFFLSELTVKLDGTPVKLQDPSHSYGKIGVGSGNADAGNVIDGEGSTGWSTSGAEGTANQWVVNFAEPLKSGSELEIELVFERHFAAGLGRFRFALTSGETPVVASTLPEPMYGWHVGKIADITEHDFSDLQRHFVKTAPELEVQRSHSNALQVIVPPQVRTLGMQGRGAKDQRVTHRHHRGEYLQPREPVGPGVPAALLDQANSSPDNRLDFAEWLVSEDNPLVARVTVNRAWREFFGRGIVDTAGDFGTQSEPPSHPRLLDWLSVDLLQNGWSLKRLHRLIVLSATYRQAIQVRNQTDPGNRLLSGMPRRRLAAEQIRDSLLAASGLLTRKIGGPSVFPPQPDGVMQMAYGAPKWRASQGSDRFRRSVYTFSKRTAPFAAFATFDGPSGETCLARRDRSTTPLQALSLLNDEMYLEYADGLAETVTTNVGQDAEPRVIASLMFRRLLSRFPEKAELQAILAFYGKYKQNPKVWMLMARALMNLDEVIVTP